ncbi:MAG: HD domain-containing protein [Firmicutes bacterium]|nr:HD domain-containing protein [Bacillota bacterium]
MLNIEKHEKIMDIVKSELSCSAHNMDHVLRVHSLCLEIGKHEKNVNLNVLIPAALLHDIARVIESKDTTGKTDHAILGSEMAEKILKELDYNDNDIEEIKHCIVAHRFRSGNEPKSIEAKILFDADKLDAIGAIGLARCFMLSGQFGQRLEIIDDLDQYIKENTTDNGRIKDVSKHTPFIEYEFKFKKIPERLFTSSAKEIGNDRIKYMGRFFNRLTKEIKGIM